MADESSTASHEEPAVLNLQALRGCDLAQVRQELDRYTSSKGAVHADTIHLTGYLVERLTEVKKHAEALPLARHALDCSQRLHGEEHGELVQPMLNVAACLIGLGRFEEAEPVYCNVLNIAQRTLGHVAPRTIECCDRLGECYQFRGKYAEAEAMHRRVLPFNMRLLGPEDPQTTFTLMRLGTCLTRSGKVDDGLDLLHQALDVNVRVHGLMMHGVTANIMALIGQALMSRGTYDQAAEVQQFGLQICFQLPGLRYEPLTLGIMGDFIKSLTHLGRTGEALDLCRLVLSATEQAYGQEHVDTMLATFRLAQLLHRMGQHAEAGPLACRALEGLSRLLHPDCRCARDAALLVQGIASAASGRPR